MALRPRVIELGAVIASIVKELAIGTWPSACDDAAELLAELDAEELAAELDESLDALEDASDALEESLELLEESAVELEASAELEESAELDGALEEASPVG